MRLKKRQTDSAIETEETRYQQIKMKLAKLEVCCYLRSNQMK